MKQLFDLSFLALAILAPQRSSSQPCAASGNIFHCAFNGHSYDIIREKKTWDSAAACAVRMGGYLAQINSRLEQDSIYYNIIHGAAVSAGYTSVADGGGASYVWIGGTDKGTEGTWIWDGNNDGSGSAFWQGQGNAGAGGGTAVASAFNNWGGTAAGSANEPDNYAGVQDAAAMALSAWPYGVASEWNDIAPTNMLYYVIEYDAPAGIDEFKNETFVYPNPAQDQMHLNSKIPLVEFTVTDLTGRVLQKEKVDAVQQLNVDIQYLPKGNFLIYLHMIDGQKVTLKFTH